MRHLWGSIAVVVVAVLTQPTYGQYKIEWAGGYPKTGTAAKGVLVKGQITITDNNYKVNKLQATAWRGGAKKLKPTDITSIIKGDLSFEAEIFAVESGKTQNVLVEVFFEKGGVKTKPFGISGKADSK